MKKARNPNLDILILAVEKLEELSDKVVFLGGCTTGLLITDQAAPPVRETIDVDVIIEVSSYFEYNKIAELLRQKGFREDQSDGSPVCRWLNEGLILDVMPTDSSILGFSNHWYKAAMDNAEEYQLRNKKIIRVVTAPYFLATKIEAFEGRGKGDYLLSHDLEDIIAVIDGRPTIADELLEADINIKSYLAEKFNKFLNDQRFIEALPERVPTFTSHERRQDILQDLFVVDDQDVHRGSVTSRFRIARARRLVTARWREATGSARSECPVQDTPTPDLKCSRAAEDRS